LHELLYVKTRQGQNICIKFCGLDITTTWTTTAGKPVREIRNKRQRQAYANRRVFLAIDRLIRAQSEQEKAQARIWAHLWA